MAADGTDPQQEIDKLYAADPEGFVAGRQALVKQLKSAGERERAGEVAALRRPTVAAWAVNQLARRHPDQLGRLLDLGRELEEAHERLLGGGRPDIAVTSGRRRREAIAGLTEQAMTMLTESGRAADAHRDAIAGTLDAASLDPEAAAVVQAGRLTRELGPPSGFGLDWVADDSSPQPRRPPARLAEVEADAGTDGEAEEGDEDPAGREAAKAEARRAARAAAEAWVDEARDEADRAAQAAAHAELEVERIEHELDEAKTLARAARRAAAEAATQAKKAAARAAAQHS